MSYWISLEGERVNDEGETSVGPLPVPEFQEGGTQPVGGTNEADLNVTYNYGKHFKFRDLDGRTGTETEAELAEVVERLGVKQDDNYWTPTEGNAGFALSILLAWARLHPTGTWGVR